MITFFISGHLSEKRRARLDSDGAKIRRWAFLLLFIAAASPIPDEPVVIPLGLMKYNPVKFFTAYFLGKLIIAIAGAFVGNIIETKISGWLSQEVIIIISIAITIVITIILLKIDLEKFSQRIIKSRTVEKVKRRKKKLNKPIKNAIMKIKHAYKTT
jgi:uncharacterized membrane protein YdjX (TVP38/TMEM64 family)